MDSRPQDAPDPDDDVTDHTERPDGESAPNGEPPSDADASDDGHWRPL